MRIGYFGDGKWAHKAFEKIVADAALSIVFVVLRNDKQDVVLRKMAEDKGIPVLVHKNINSWEFLNIVAEYGAEIFVSMSFNQIFKTHTINFPQNKTINCHAGKLPFYRGRNILNWALINDEKEFGITVHYMDEGIDTGDIILQKTYEITDDDDYGTLLERAYEGCAQVLYDAIKLIENGDVQCIKQNSIDEVGTYYGMRQEGDEVIDWTQTSREIFNFVRALSNPGPQATSWVRGAKIRINKVKLIPGAHVYKCITGQVLGKTEEGFLIKTGDTILEVVEYECEKKIMVGDRLVNYE